MTRPASLAIALALLLICASAPAETLYVTDQLYLGLYPSPQASGHPLTTMVSGTPLSVLENTSRMAKVRSPDGTVGWVKRAYLVADKPARLIVSQLQTRTAAAEARLAAARQQAQTAQTQAATLRQTASSAAELSQRQRAQLADLREQNRAYRRQAAAYATSVALPWFLSVTVLTLAAGFGAGLLWVDRRIRKRHGGFRIY